MQNEMPTTCTCLVYSNSGKRDRLPVDVAWGRETCGSHATAPPPWSWSSDREHNTSPPWRYNHYHNNLPTGWATPCVLKVLHKEHQMQDTPEHPASHPEWWWYGLQDSLVHSCSRTLACRPATRNCLGVQPLEFVLCPGTYGAGNEHINEIFEVLCADSDVHFAVSLWFCLNRHWLPIDTS